MSRRSIPFTRLSIVFIAAMILSGGILTYFSINNISNLKKLTEKQILEEQQKLAVRFSDTLQENLEQLAASLIYDPDQAGSSKSELIQLSSDQNYITQAFILGGNGQFLFPNFTGISAELSNPTLSNRFTASYELGEKAEFAENDFTQALKHYQSCLNLSTGAIDSVTALNALGRASVKSGNSGNATKYYLSIIRNYYAQTDRNGFPFAYYALFHLVNYSDAENLQEIAPTIENCLGKMVQGIIPLNFQSGEVLDLIRDWSREYIMLDSLQFTQINRSIESVDQQNQFINLYGDVIPRLVVQENQNNQYTLQNGFSIENLYSESDQQFLIFKKGNINTTGFLIDRNRLFNVIAAKRLQSDLDFEYIFSFPSSYDSNTDVNSLSSAVPLTPFFPEQTMQIRIADENLIDDLVRRRSWIYGIASVLLLAAMFLGIILTSRDIAREKHIAKLRSNFISNVTHELKTPLTSIRMYAESLMMKRIKSDSGQRKYLSVVINESERLKRMINNILDFSKMEKAKLEYHPVESDLSEILQTAILDMNYWLEKNGFNVQQKIERDVKAQIDPEKLYQVYTNLLSNAIKYSGDSKNIYIRLYRNGDSIITEVEDEGIGIARENQARIFEEFYRVDKQEAGNITGTGLGLTVVKEIVEAHQGKIEVESEIGKGSKFSVILFQRT